MALSGSRVLEMTLISTYACCAVVACSTHPERPHASARPQALDSAPLSLEAFVACVGASGTEPTCRLEAGTHLVNEPIRVLRSDVALVGDPENAESVVLRRGSDHGEVLSVGDDGVAPLRGVTITGIVIDGAAPMPSCLDNNCVDFWVHNACATAASCSGNVTGFSGDVSVRISRMIFRNAPAHSVALYGNVESRVNDVVIEESEINDSVLTGLLVGANGIDGTAAQCDHGIKARWAPSNITVRGNKFLRNGTGAFGVNVSRYFDLDSNLFDDNYRDPVPELPSGGTVFFDQCTDVVRIVNNEFIGPRDTPTHSTGALELWGRNTLVQGNILRDYPLDGVGANSVYNLTVVDNVIVDNNLFTNTDPGRGWRAGGITIWNRVGHRLTNGVTVARNRVTNTNRDQTQTYGVYIETGDGEDKTIANLTIRDNDFAGNRVSPLCVHSSVNLVGEIDIEHPSACEQGDTATAQPEIHSASAVANDGSADIVIEGANLEQTNADGIHLRCQGGAPRLELLARAENRLVARVRPPVSDEITCSISVGSRSGSLTASTEIAIPPAIDAASLGAPFVTNARSLGCWGATIEGRDFAVGAMAVFIRDSDWTVLTRSEDFEVLSRERIRVRIPAELQDQFYERGFRFTTVNMRANVETWTSEPVMCR